MNHYRILLEIEKGICRKIFVKRNNIIEAMDVAKKIKAERLLYIIPITYEQYMKGISLKYTTNI